MRIWISILIVLGTYLLAPAQIQVSAVFDSTEILIGDQVNLRLQVNAPPNTYIQFPILDKPGDLEVIRLGNIDTLSRSPELILKQDATISAFDSGVYILPRLEFPYGFQANNIIDTLLSNPVRLIVNTVPLDSMDIRPIKPILKERVLLSDYIWYILTPIIILALIGLIVLIFVFRKKKAEEAIPEVIEPAHVIGFRKLKELEGKGLWQKGEIKAYQSELSFILREYLENRYDILALESTTEELLALLKKQDIKVEWQNRLTEVFQTSDLVKFAKSTPEEEVHRRFMDYANRFVEETQYIEPEPSEGDEDSINEIPTKS